MINEGLVVSKSTTYKTTINKLCKYLLSTKSYVTSRHKVFDFTTDESLYSLSIHVDLDIIPVKFVTEENSDNLYIMLEYKAIPKSNNLGITWGYPSESIKKENDVVANILSATLNKGTAYCDKIRPDFSADISNEDAVKRLTYNDIKNSKAYQKIKSFVDDLLTTQIQCEMPYFLYKRIKNRKNVIPVCWISNRDEKLYYINDRNYSSDKCVNRNCLGTIYMSSLVSKPQQIGNLKDWNCYLDWNNWVVPVKDSIPHCVRIW